MNILGLTVKKENPGLESTYINAKIKKGLIEKNIKKMYR